jgi:hypothetical protein
MTPSQWLGILGVETRGRPASDEDTAMQTRPSNRPIPFLWQQFSRFILMVGMGVAALAGPAHASNALGLAYDQSFGNFGYQSTPYYATADLAVDMKPIGLVHLSGGGYIQATLQQVGGNPRIVLARFTEDGQIDGNWGNNGSELPGLPVPYVAGSNSFIYLVDGNQGGQDIFYLAYSFLSGSNYYVAVAKFLANGSFDANFGQGGYVSSNLPNRAPAGLDVVLGAAFVTVSGTPTLVVGVGTSSVGFALIPVAGTGPGAIPDNSNTVILQLGGYPRIFQARSRAGDHVEWLGMFNGNALHLDFDATTHGVATHTFQFHCPNGMLANQSGIDAIERPAAFGDDVLLLGRESCSDVGGVALVARVAGLATAPVETWITRTEANTACSSLNTQCETAYLGYSEANPGIAVTITPQRTVAPVRIPSGAAMPRLPLDTISPFTTILPSTYRGTIYRYPRIVTYAEPQFGPSGHGLVGLLLDGLFSDTFDPVAPP